MLNNHKKYFINFIQDYFKSLHGFSLVENYHLHTFIAAKNADYTEFITIIKGGEEVLKSDPNLRLLKDNYDITLKIIEYKNFLHYTYQILKYSLKFSKSTFYTNGHNIYMYLCIIFPKMFSFGKVKNIFMAHTQPIRGGLGFRKLKQFFQDKILFRFFVDRIRLNNITEKEYLLNKGIKKNKLLIVPLVVDDKIFYKKKDPKGRTDLLYFGQITKKKNVDTILTAFKNVISIHNFQNLKLHLIGKVGTDYNLDKKIHELGINDNIVRYGFVELKELNELLNQTLIYLNDSFDEGQCVAVYEAALAGNALCLPNIMSFKEVFRDSALIHKQGNVDDLTNNILKYLNNMELVEEKCKNAIEMIKQDFNENIILEKMIRLFEFDYE